jgi:hypothetical protein
MARYGHAQREPIIAREYIGLPAKPHKRVALAQYEAVARVGHSIDFGEVRGDVGVERGEATFVAAVEDVEKEHSIPTCSFRWSEDVDFR